ncbi:MAG: hypothetical protein HOU01_07295 [Streptomycetaceae bacterium]|nr:hypothetical protein [Streptomycetaceae bacterium]
MAGVVAAVLLTASCQSDGGSSATPSGGTPTATAVPSDIASIAAAAESAADRADADTAKGDGDSAP